MTSTSDTLIFFLTRRGRGSATRALTRLCVVLASISLWGCGGSGGTTQHDDAGPSTTQDAGVFAGSDAAAGGPSFPQALGGAMWANPAVYPQVTLHVQAPSDATSITLLADGTPLPTSDADGDHDYTATLSLEGRSGTMALEATANPGREGFPPRVVRATLHLGTEGKRMSMFDDLGPTLTPHLHDAGDAVWLTWADATEMPRLAHARRIDGAGDFVGTSVDMRFSTDVNTLYTRTAFGAGRFGVFFQRPAMPYFTNHFAIVDTTGAVLEGPIALDPEGRKGRWGGAVVFDGEAFDVLFRAGEDEDASLYVTRVDATTFAVTGPSEIARTGMNDPNGMFDRFANPTMLPLGNQLLVAFTRERYFASIDTPIFKAQLARLSLPDLSVRDTTYIGQERALRSEQEAWVFADGDGAAVIRTEVDLEGASDELPTQLRFTRAGADGSLDAARGAGTAMLTPLPENERDQVAYLPLGDGTAAIVWNDERTYVDINTGRIEMYAGRVDRDGRITDVRLFPAARFLKSEASFSLIRRGTNVLVVWLDERTSGRVTDPKPELYFETLWY